MAALFGAALIATTGPANAATVTNHVLVNFDGSLAGTAYTLGTGEVDTTNSFAASVGSEVVAGGVATLDSSVAGGSQGGEGFFFDVSAFNSGGLVANSFIMEAIVTPSAGFAQGTGQASGFASILAYAGHGTLRYAAGSGGNTIQTNFWDGSINFTANSSAIPPAGLGSHVAVVLDLGREAASVTSSYYLNGQLIATAGPGAIIGVRALGGFGQEVHDQTTNQQRGFDGLLDAVAFSTYTGTFDPANDFQIIREPASLIDFDSLSAGVQAGDVLAGSGVTFTTGNIPNAVAVSDVITLSGPVQEFEIFAEASAAISPPNFAGGVGFNDLLMSFAIPVTSVAVTSDDYVGEPADLIRLLALAPARGPNEFTVLAIDEAFDNAVSPPENRLSVNLSGKSFGFALFQTTTEAEGFDDLTFTPVPEPSTLLLLTSSLLGSWLSAASAFRRKRLFRKM